MRNQRMFAAHLRNAHKYTEADAQRAVFRTLFAARQSQTTPARPAPPAPEGAAPTVPDEVYVQGHCYRVQRIRNLETPGAIDHGRQIIKLRPHPNPVEEIQTLARCAGRIFLYLCHFTNDEHESRG